LKLWKDLVVPRRLMCVNYSLSGLGAAGAFLVFKGCNRNLPLDRE